MIGFFIKFSSSEAAKLFEQNLTAFGSPKAEAPAPVAVYRDDVINIILKLGVWNFETSSVE